MAKGSYATKQILNWMEYFSKEMQVSPEKIKLLDICGKQKNVIPTVEGHKRVLILQMNPMRICSMISGRQALAIMICGMRLASRKKDR